MRMYIYCTLYYSRGKKVRLHRGFNNSVIRSVMFRQVNILLHLISLASKTLCHYLKIVIVFTVTM